MTDLVVLRAVKVSKLVNPNEKKVIICIKFYYVLKIIETMIWMMIITTSITNDNVADNVQDGRERQRPSGGKVQAPTLGRHAPGSVHLREVSADLHPQRLWLPPESARDRTGEGHQGPQVEPAVGHEAGRFEGFGSGCSSFENGRWDAGRSCF